MHVPGLAIAVSELTLAHAQMLLPVPMEGLCSGPASLVAFEDAMGFPMRPIGDQDFPRLCGIGRGPQDQDPHWVMDVWQSDRLAEIPLGMACDREFGPHQQRETRGPGTERVWLPIDLNRAIRLEVADVRASFAVDVVQNRSIGKVAVEREVTGNLFGDYPVNEILDQFGVVLERVVRITLLALAETAERERVVFAARRHIVGEQVVMRDQVAFVGMIPEVASILDQRAVVVDQGVVDRNHAIVTVAGGRVVLEPFEAMSVDALNVPRRFRQPAVETGLVSRDRKLARDATDGFVLGNKQAGEVFGEVNAGGFVWEEVAKLHEQLFDHLGDGDDRWHHTLPLSTPDPTKSYAVPRIGANLQKSSYKAHIRFAFLKVASKE